MFAVCLLTYLKHPNVHPLAGYEAGGGERTAPILQAQARPRKHQKQRYSTEAFAMMVMCVGGWRIHCVATPQEAAQIHRKQHNHLKVVRCTDVLLCAHCYSHTVDGA